jgi:hypothetical protein
VAALMQRRSFESRVTRRRSCGAEEKKQLRAVIGSEEFKVQSDEIKACPARAAAWPRHARHTHTHAATDVRSGRDDAARNILLAAASQGEPAVAVAAAAAAGSGGVALSQLARNSAATYMDLLYALVEVKQLLGPAVELRFKVFGRDAVFGREKGDGGGECAPDAGGDDAEDGVERGDANA